MRCLITGINGFAASFLAKELLKKKFSVAGTYRKETGEKSAEIKLYGADLLEAEKISYAMENFIPDYIFHLAAISSTHASVKKPELTYKTNVQGTENVLRGAVKTSPSSRVLVVGTSGEYGSPKSIPIKETHPLNPETPYAKSKLEAERLALAYFKKYGLKTVCTRSFNHIGPGQSEAFVCSTFAKQVAEIEKGLREPVIYVGNLEVKRDFTDVRDTVRAYMLALEKGSPGEVYNICSGKAHSIKEVLQIILDFSDKEIEIKVDKQRLRKADIPTMVGDNSKLKKDTKWKPRFSIEQSLKDMLDYWRSRL